MTPEKTMEATKKSAGQVAPVIEAYRKIHTNLAQLLESGDKRSVVFIGAESGAGASTLSANLAIVIAQTGARVLVMDADMRAPAQCRNFKVPDSAGLSAILAGLATPDDCIHKQVKPNVDLLPSGSTPSNPSEMLCSSRMRALLEEVSNRYDYVFIDCPSLCVATDALTIARHTAGVVLTARYNRTTCRKYAKTMKQIEAAGITLLGAVICDQQERERKFGFLGK